MGTITVKDGTTIYYKDWGSGPVVTFSHGWPLNADAWDAQLHFLAENGFRVIAHDRCGRGRSSQAWSGNDMNGYADDLAELIESLDLKEITLIGHSTGGGEVARYIGRHSTKRIAAAVLIAAVPPIMVKSAANPEGVPIEVFDRSRSSLLKDRSQFYNISSTYGSKPGAGLSHYGASKAALEYLTRAWALELAPMGVRVNSLSVGPTESGALTGMMGLTEGQAEAVKRQEREQVPLGRRGFPDEVARWIVSFAISGSE